MILILPHFLSMLICTILVVRRRGWWFFCSCWRVDGVAASLLSRSYWALSWYVTLWLQLLLGGALDIYLVMARKIWLCCWVPSVESWDFCKLLANTEIIRMIYICKVCVANLLPLMSSIWYITWYLQGTKKSRTHTIDTNLKWSSLFHLYVKHMITE